MSAATFAGRILAWFARHGRKDLPWQSEPTPYRVWVSEIMLQQTRVATVIPYYERFMARFPDVEALAAASLDQVLHHWSGLGYYARARNLHAAARLIAGRWRGEFPDNLDEMQSLPGIGRSTAGAILALAGGQRHAILDGNVKRVLSRFHAVAGWPGQAAVQNILWTLAEQATPQARVAAYTQAMMDLGATVCTRSRPRCGQCPLAADCRAHAAGREKDYPTPRPRRQLPLRETRMLLLCNDAGEVLLERRPAAGIWGGLWCFPELQQDAPVETWCRDLPGGRARVIEEWAPVRHTFTHFHLEITPVLAVTDSRTDAVMDEPDRLWYNTLQRQECGLAAPVDKLLRRLYDYQAMRNDHDPNGAVRKAG